MAEESALLRALGLRVRTLRDERGWSRRLLAMRTELSERFLAQVESGEGNPSVQSLERIARALDTTPSELLASPPRARVIALLGLRGAGKSTVGRALAERTGSIFTELDARIEEAAGLSLGEIFELHGEDYYRAREREALERVLADGYRVPEGANDASGRSGKDSGGVILAAGGGIVTHPENFALLRANATTVWLRATPEEHWERVVAQGDHRPMANDPLARTHLRELLARREDLYRTADQTIDTSGASIESIVDRLAPLLTV